MLNQKQVEIVREVLTGAFGQSVPLIQADGEFICADGWTITEGDVEIRSILGYANVPGFSLYGGEEEVMADRSFYAVVLRLAQEIATQRAERVLEKLATDDFVRDLEEDDRLAKEYFASVARG